MKKRYSSLLLIVTQVLYAQETIQTDRPDQTESTSITPKSNLQLESGFFYEKTDTELRNISHPTLLIKYGVNKNLELRVGTDFNSETVYDERYSGISPVTLGFKAKLLEERKFMPAIAFLGQLTLNRLASKNFKTPYTAPSFRLLFNHTLSDKVNLGYNLGAEWNGVTPDVTGVYTVSTSYSFDEKLGMFAEFYGYLNKFEKADHRFDAGFTYLISNNFQVDTSAGVGISEISPDYFVSAGVSYRFSTK